MKMQGYVAVILWILSSFCSAFVPTSPDSRIRFNRRQPCFATLPDDHALQDVLQVAIQASKKAGSIILKHAEGADVVETKSTNRDLLTIVDPLCEKVRSWNGSWKSWLDEKSTVQAFLKSGLYIISFLVPP